MSAHRRPWLGATSSATGATAPVTLEWWLNATTLTRSSSCSESRSMRPSSVTPYQRRVAPVRCASSCQGMRLAWCSSSVVTMTSPGPTAWSNRLSPNTYATRLIASVAFLVNTSSSASAPTNAAIVGPPLFVGVGGLLHQLVRASVHRAVGGDQEVALGVEHLQRALRCGAGIQICQPVSAAHHPRSGSGNRRGPRRDQETG